MKNRVYIWGTGKNERTISETWKLYYDELEIIGYIDNNIEKQNSLYKGKPVLSPSEALDKEFNAVIICSTFKKEIEDELIKKYKISKDKIYGTNYFYQLKILERYKENIEPEVQDILTYLKAKPLRAFCYPEVDSFMKKEVDICYDVAVGLYYVIHNHRKLYINRKYDTEDKVREYYRTICSEQFPGSPHSYIHDEHVIRENDIIVDAGVADGIFSLDAIELAEQIYLIECDEQWIEALKLTFADYENKVTIVQGFLDSYNGKGCLTLDSLKLERVNFIKMDIEGMETEALKGAQRTITNADNIRMSICCYHKDNDAVVIKMILESYGVHAEYSNGYMWFGDSDTLRKGLVYGYKEKK